MPEPVSIVAAAVSIVSSTYTLCKSSSDIVSGVKDAPQHITRISEDLDSFYPVLRALKAAFQNVEADPDGMIEETGAAVHRSLQQCLCIFRDLTFLVNEYKTLQSSDSNAIIRYDDGRGRYSIGKCSSSNGTFTEKRSMR